jgi:enamine deaminase RidA (YjgF/YER057c/UK114 family)
MSHAVVHAGVVYTSGHVDSAAPDVATQTKNVLARIEAVLHQAGSDKSRILSASIWLSDISAFAEMNAVWEGWIAPGAAPARATVESKLAAPEYKVEIAVIAAVAAQGSNG